MHSYCAAPPGTPSRVGLASGSARPGGRSVGRASEPPTDGNRRRGSGIWREANGPRTPPLAGTHLPACPGAQAQTPWQRRDAEAPRSAGRAFTPAFPDTYRSRQGPTPSGQSPGGPLALALPDPSLRDSGRGGCPVLIRLASEEDQMAFVMFTRQVRSQAPDRPPEPRRRDGQEEGQEGEEGAVAEGRRGSS